jgi:hypothetical protein
MRKTKKYVHKFYRKTSKASPPLRLKSGWKIPDESIELGLEDVTCIGLAEFCVNWYRIELNSVGVQARTGPDALRP